jgi:hypothetical protein
MSDCLSARRAAVSMAARENDAMGFAKIGDLEMYYERAG